MVVNRKGKKRLIVDARYLNMYLRYMALKYESLADAIAQLQKGDYMWLTNFKSGYHQVPMHPDTYQYLGLMIAGRVYVMPFLRFGVASACREYTQLMAEVYRPLRLKGKNMAFLIDDAVGAAARQGKARYHALTFVMVLSALGFYLSVEKCLLDPALRGLFLGLLLDSQQCMTWVPEDKLQ